MNRTRFYLIVALLGFALAITVMATVGEIRQDLLVRGQKAIAAAGIPYYDLRIDGRDAVLAGFVTEDTDVARLTAVVGQVNGIRTVRNEVTVERIAPSAREGVSVRAGRPPELRAQHLGDVLIVTGSLPMDGSADELERALTAAFPCATLRMDVRQDDSVGARAWTGSLGRIVAALAELDEPSRLAAYGEVVQLSGQISEPAQRARLDDILMGLPTVEWRLTVINRSGSIGGTP
jgi:hypothetical protein